MEGDQPRDPIMLDGKVAIVTGAAGGIGAATARLMARRGASVVIADIAGDAAQAAARRIGEDGATAIALPVDLADEASVVALIEETVSRFGRLDILHNNAAALTPELHAADLDIARMETWAWDRSFAVNCRGTMIAMRTALPHLVTSRGAIVNTVAAMALRGHALQAAYTASKAAVIQMTRSVAASHGRLGVRCNAVAPGLILTPVVRDHLPPEMLTMTLGETLNDRLGEPEDVAQMAAFLASDAAGHVNGQVVTVDGGYISHIPGVSGLS
ncbi:Short-chain dehydrogenase/reductase SDR [Sphingomonas paucimobilis]|nr:Short-chain dehydrogenase/reductase SDR [Sphingomonas paucimobilis]